MSDSVAATLLILYDRPPDDEESFHIWNRDMEGAQRCLRRAAENSQNLRKALRYIFQHLSELSPNSPDEDYDAVFYDAAKMFFGTEKAQIREFFRTFYWILFGQESGARLGTLVKMIGFDDFRALVEKSLENFPTYVRD
jgi:lysyl-tRNA synthetase class I